MANDSQRQKQGGRSQGNASFSARHQSVDFYFKRYASRRLPKTEDQKDLVQQAWLEAISFGFSFSKKLAAKTAIRVFLRDQYGLAGGKRYEYPKESPEPSQSFADTLDLGIPANQNDRLAAMPYRIVVGGKIVKMDRWDLAELLGIKPESVKTAKNMRRTYQLWLYEGVFYPSVIALQRATKKRASTAKKLAQKVPIKWQKD